MRQRNELSPTWMTIQEVADLVADDYSVIVSFITADRIPYRFHPDGIEIWFEGFQTCMNDLYDLEGYVNDLYEAREWVPDEQDVLKLLTEYDRENRDV